MQSAHLHAPHDFCWDAWQPYPCLGKGLSLSAVTHTQTQLHLSLR